MKKAFQVFVCYALIPFAACLPLTALLLCGAPREILLTIPILIAVIYLIFRKKLDMAFAARTNGTVFLLLLAVFTLLMLLSSGSVEGRLAGYFSLLLLPFAPVLLYYSLMGQVLTMYVTALLSYAAAFLVCGWFGQIRWKKVLALLAPVLVCAALNGVLYAHRPAVKYGGHGFAYMQGYSSTDFSDYMVYSPHSRLAVPEQEASLIIEREEDMPVLDGAEACYPLYAAYAKAVYRDIDRIEARCLQDGKAPAGNGKIVTFTNSIRGFQRLLRRSWDPPEKFGGGVDMFFGARPSPSQLREAEEYGVELEITPIAWEAFVFFVEADNPVEDLTAEQLRGIYHGDITNWRELGGKDQEILAFQRPRDSGSQTMMDAFMGDVTLKEPQTYEIVSAMEGVIRMVAQYANEDGSMGYSFRYFLEELHQEQGVKMLSVDGVCPSLENIENGSYPLRVPVCLVTRKNDPNPYVQKMIDFILSPEGQEIAAKTGYAPLSKATE